MIPRSVLGKIIKEIEEAKLRKVTDPYVATEQHRFTLDKHLVAIVRVAAPEAGYRNASQLMAYLLALWLSQNYDQVENWLKDGRRLVEELIDYYGHGEDTMPDLKEKFWKGGTYG